MNLTFLEILRLFLAFNLCVMRVTGKSVFTDKFDLEDLGLLLGDAEFVALIESLLGGSDEDV